MIEIAPSTASHLQMWLDGVTADIAASLDYEVRKILLPNRSEEDYAYVLRECRRTLATQILEQTHHTDTPPKHRHEYPDPVS